MKKFWTEREDAIMREHYPHKPTSELMEMLGRSERSVYMRAKTLGLLKTAEYLASPAACRLRRGDNVGAGSRFKKGHATWNKGIHWAPPGSEKGHFKKGSKPKNALPIGTERVFEDGTLYVKISETGKRFKDWKPVQSLIWERLHGPIPKGHFVVLRDRSKTNFSPENLELVTRAENMRRNTIHNYPPELVSIIRHQDWLNRAIKERENNEQHRHAA